jgi:YgiT-type zinc finger domain-containing protein
MRRHEYGDCSFCGGKVVEKRVSVDYRLGKELIIFEQVPAGVCQQCGEKYYTSDVAKELEQLALDKSVQHHKVITVPVKNFRKAI